MSTAVDSPSLMRLRPFTVTVGTLVLFLVWMWIDISTMDFRPGRFADGRTTAGWFVLGAPIFLGIGVLMALFFAWVARRYHPVVSWIGLLVLFVPLIAHAVERTTPEARLARALDISLPPGIAVQRLQQSDSFGDGDTVTGICTAPPEFAETLIVTHDLHVQPHGAGLQLPLPEIAPERSAPIYANEFLDIYYDSEQSLLYFYRRPAQPL